MAVTRTITDRTRALQEFEASIKEFGQELQAGLEETFADVLEEGEEIPDFTFFQELILRKVRFLLAALSEAEDLVSRTHLEGKNRREQRDELAQKIRRLLRKIRDGFQLAYGRDRGDALVGLRGRLTAVPVDLARHAKLVLKLLEEADRLPAGEDRTAVFQGNPENWAGRLRDSVPALDVATEQATASLKLLESAQGKRSRALESFNAFFVDAGGFLESLYRLGGLDEGRARNFRPSKQDPGLTLNQSRLKRAISQGHKSSAKRRESPPKAPENSAEGGGKTKPPAAGDG